MRQLEGVAVLPDLPGEDSPPSGNEVLRPPGLVEEGERDLADSVTDDDFEDQATALAHASLPDASDLGDDRHRLPHRQRHDGRQLASTGVAARIVLEEIGDRLHAEGTVQGLRRLLAHRCAQSRVERERRHASSLDSGSDTASPGHAGKMSATISDRKARAFLFTDDR